MERLDGLTFVLSLLVLFEDIAVGMCYFLIEMIFHLQTNTGMDLG